MAQLVPVSSSPEASWHAIADDARAPVDRLERYVVSTEESRVLLNQPEIVGCEYTALLGAAMAVVLRTAPFRRFLVDTPPPEICVLHVLRGGLNFGIREAMHEAFGFFRHGSAFLSAERRRLPDGTWTVVKDLYRKIDLPREAVLLLGDVVATGVTLDHALRAVEDRVRRGEGSVRRIFAFTVGCERCEEVLAEHDARLRELSPAWEGATAVYLEGRFALAREDTPIRHAVPDTDLLRTGALATPEFEASLTTSAGPALERCVIYDAGSRAFGVPAYVADVLDHWRTLGDRARGGFTLAQALAERGFADHPAAKGGTAAALLALAEARRAALAPMAKSAPLTPDRGAGPRPRSPRVGR